MTLTADIDLIDAALGRIREEFETNPTAEKFMEHRGSIIRLEQTLRGTTTLHAAVAVAAEQADAGRLVGSTSFLDWMMKELDLSFPEAMHRYQLGHMLYHEPSADPQPEPDPDPAREDETDLERAEREAREKTEREAREKAERDARLKAQEKARARARQARLNAEKTRIINQELDKLKDGTKPSRDELFHLALIEAESRTPGDLRRWVRAHVNKANSYSADPLAAHKNRRIRLGKQDAAGGCAIDGYLSPPMAALVQNALDSMSKIGSLMEDPTAVDIRTPGQRRADAFAEVFRRFNEDMLPNRKGIGSIVVSLSAKDIANLESNGPGYRYNTNTGVQLTPYDIFCLGTAQHDFGAVLDTESGRPLYLGRTKRSASLEQRIALLASELVCTGEDCEAPMSGCDVHHIQPWSRGGRTDIDQLTFQCHGDHPKNRIEQDGAGNMGHMDIDPATGRVGYQPADPNTPLRFNETQAQSESGGARTRGQPWPDEAA